MKFYLGTHRADWLGRVEVPLFVSHRVLNGRRRLPVASAGWALDSGGFSELSMYGEWRTGADDYLAAVRRYRDEIGRLEWAAPRDWMCEPAILDRTGLTVAEHQRRTTADFLDLRGRAPDLPIIPVLQGWDPGDYLDHLDMYADAGVDLAAERLVGVGSVCRRQATGQVERIFAMLAWGGLRLHGFGVKIVGLRASAQWLTSADSMAWSYWGRRTPTMCGSTRHKSEQNCLAFALAWRARLTEPRAEQLALAAPRGES